MLRLKLRRESPDLERDLHRRAARWLRKNRTPAEAARQAVAGGDWQLAARIAVDDLVIDQLLEPPGVQPLAEVLQRIPQGQTWGQPPPLLVTAATAVARESRDQEDSADASLVGRGARCWTRLASRGSARFSSRLAAGGRSGPAWRCRQAAASTLWVPRRRTADEPCWTRCRHDAAGTGTPTWVAQVLIGRAAVELWSGNPGKAADLFDSGQRPR